VAFLWNSKGANTPDYQSAAQVVWSLEQNGKIKQSGKSIKVKTG